MKRCVICKRPLPDGAKGPLCEQHAAQLKEKGAAAAGAGAALVVGMKNLAPKVVPKAKEAGRVVVPIVRENGSKVVKAIGRAVAKL